MTIRRRCSRRGALAHPWLWARSHTNGRTSRPATRVVLGSCTKYYVLFARSRRRGHRFGHRFGRVRARGGRRPGGSGSPSGLLWRLSNISLLHNLSRSHTCRRRASRPRRLAFSSLWLCRYLFFVAVWAALRRRAASPGSQRGRVRCGSSPVVQEAKKAAFTRERCGCI